MGQNCKMVVIRAFVGLSLILWCTTGFSQKILLRDVTGIPLKVDENENVEGSPYIIDNWTDGYIWLKNSRPIHIQLKYNTFKNELVVFKDNAALVVTNAESFGWIGSNKDSINFKKVVFKGNDNLFFVRVLYTGKNSLYKRISTTKSLESAGYSDARKIEKYNTTEKLFLVGPQGAFELRKVKDLKNALSQYGDAVDPIMKKYDVSLKNEKSVIDTLTEIEKGK